MPRDAQTQAQTHAKAACPICAKTLSAVPEHLKAYIRPQNPRIDDDHPPDVVRTALARLRKHVYGPPGESEEQKKRRLEVSPSVMQHHYGLQI